MIALIPARGGSKGIPKKNICLVNGFPLIDYTIVACIMAGVENIYVSTDSEEIADVALKFYPFVKIIDRPSELAQDDTKDLEVLKHFFELFPQCSEVLFMRPTTPIRKPEVIQKAIDFYFNRELDEYKEITGMKSAHELNEPPYKMCQLDEKGMAKGFFEDYKGNKDYMNLPRQTFPKAYHPNGYVDIIKKETVMQGSEYGDKVKLFVTEETIEIDKIYDLDLAGYRLSAKINDLPNLDDMVHQTVLFCELMRRYKQGHLENLENKYNVI